MQSMASSLPEAIGSSSSALTPATLAAAFARVSDPRRPHGRRFALAAILALAVVALLSNHLSVLAIAQWGKRQSPAVLAALGFPDGITPHQTTLQRLFRTLDPVPLAAALTGYFAPPAASDDRPRGSDGVAFDGKAHRGRLACADQPEYPVGRPLGRMTLGEDRSLIHTGNGPSIMAILRDTVVSVLHRAGWRTIAERLRFYSGNPQAALALLGIPLMENA